MIQKTAATLLISNEVSEVQPASLKFVTERLLELNYDIKKTKIVTCEEKILTEEIQTCVKQYDIVIVIGGLDSAYAEHISQVTSKVVHQKHVFNHRLAQLLNLDNDSKLAYVPNHAKLLEYSILNGSNNVHNVPPVVYVQGIFFVTGKLDPLKMTFVHVLEPFFKKFNKKPIFKKIVYVNFAKYGNSLKIKLTEDVNVDFDQERGIKMTLTSTKLQSLLDYEQSLKELYPDIESVADVEIPKLVYSQTCFPHVKNSIECIEECFAKYGPKNVFVSFNGGKDCTVLLHLILGVLKKHYPKYADKLLCLYVENTNAFPELNNFVSQCCSYYNLNMVKLTKSIKESLAFVLDDKPNMKACLMGTRRTDPYCEHLQTFQMTDPNWPQVMRVSPLLEWHYSEIWDYLLHLGVPYCSLYDMGYTSLGSTVNTIRNPSLTNSQDPECQMYLPAYKLLDASEERKGRVQT